MNDAVRADIGCAERGVGRRADQRWPAVAAFLTAWLMPATTARRTNHVSLRWAYGIHCLAAILTAAVVLVLVTSVEPVLIRPGGVCAFKELRQFIGEV
ncbi:MAG: hypothetical protein JXQ73_31470 [Phycisphaerae bacterium]|nr:hypothetical protein [Phycisphaerae bacterium]